MIELHNNIVLDYIIQYLNLLDTGCLDDIELNELRNDYL